MIEKMKEISKAKLIIILVAVVAIVLILVLLLTDKNKNTDTYYEDEYPIKVSSQNNGGLVITLDGSKTSGVEWTVEENESENPVISVEKKVSKKGKLTLIVTPNQTGYDHITVDKTGVISEMEYPVATVYMEIVVEEDEEGNLKASMVSSSEETTDSISGADDTDTPYLIVKNMVYLPKDGDWILYDASKDPTEDNENISLGMDDSGRTYYRVDSLGEEESIDLILKNEALETELSLKATTNDAGEIVIKKGE